MAKEKEYIRDKERLAILNHYNHTLYIEDVYTMDLRKYNYKEEEYIKDVFGFDNFSWDYIIRTEYYPAENKDGLSIEFEDFYGE